MKSSFLFTLICFTLIYLVFTVNIFFTNNSVIKNDTIPSKYIETFKYKGHTMIYIQNKGILHDPECKYCYDKFN